MSVLFNIADKIIFGNTVPDYATFRKRVLADGGTITDDAQLQADMEWVWRYKPSWFASPAVRKTGVLYGAPDLDGVVTRATTKTGINADGAIGTRVAGELPWSYKDGRISFLPESARTNLLRRTEEFDNTDRWARTNVTVTANQAIAPDGENTMDLFDEGTATGSHFLQQTISKATASIAMSAFVYIKRHPTDTPDRIAIACVDTGVGNGAVLQYNTIDDSISAFTIGSGFSIISSKIDIVNNIAEISFYFTTNADGQIRTRVFSAGVSGSYPYSFTGTNRKFFIWGAQLEVGSFASTYIKNVNTANGVTRDPDVLTVTGLEDINGFYTEANIRALSSARIIQAYGTDEENGYFLLVTSDNRIRAEVRVLDAVTAFVQTAPVTAGNYDISVRWDGDLQLVVDGVLIGAQTPSSTPTGDDFKLGGNLNDTGFLNDSIYRTAGFIDATKLENIE
jgi:hypothetical protein